MNDIEEAISYIESTKKHLLHLGETWYAEYLDDAIELLKEQEPVPVYEAESRTGICQCGNIINRSWHPEYCGFCGKKLLWH